ncbi:MAG: type VI secretion system baseplate subunit TssK [Gammaproteobacteria bacterium]
MRTNKPLYWHQGLFLQPQHLQYADLYHARQTALMAALGTPHLWGLVSLSINEAALNNRQFEVESGQFLFPDGTLADLPGNAVLPSRSFASAWADPNLPLRVHVGLRRLGDDGGNATRASDGNSAGSVNARFAVVETGDEMTDLYHAGTSARVETMTYVLRLFWDDEVAGLDDWQTIPLAELNVDGEQVRLSGSYIPPCVHMGASSALLRICKDIRDELVGRARQLEEYKAPASSGGDVRAVRYRMALQTLGRYAPLLYHYLETQAVHPWTLYGTLRQLVGELSVFSDRLDLLGETMDGESLLKPYDPYRSGTGFQNAYKAVTQLLNEITVGPELLVPLEQREQGKFGGGIPNDFIAEGNIYYLVLRTERNFDELLESFQRYAKVGAIDEVEVFVQRALPGVPLRYLKLQPEGMPRRPNATYFRIDRDDPTWGAVQRARNVALVWDEAPDDLHADIVTVKR